MIRTGIGYSQDFGPKFFLIANFLPKYYAGSGQTGHNLPLLPDTPPCLFDRYLHFKSNFRSCQPHLC